MQRRTFLTAAAGLFRPTAARAAERVLRFVPDSNLATIDPVWNVTPTTRNHGMMVWDTLYGRDASMAPQPQMVAGHELSSDGLTWQFTLRPGLAFHDGGAVKAADCVPSITRWAARRPLGQRLLAQTAAMSALDDTRFEIRLRQPFPQMTQALSEFCFIMPERIARTDPGTRITEVVGSGPFRFVTDEWVAGSGAVYQRFDGYQPRAEATSFTAGGKIVHFDRVEWQVMPDLATAVAALQRGEVDWVQQPALDLLPLLQKAPGVKVLANDHVGVMGMLALNHLYPPFDNVDARRALLSAIDQADFMSAVASDAPGATLVPVGYFTPGSAMASTAGMQALTAPRDLSRAKAMLAASGQSGARVVVLSPTDSPALQAMSLVAADLFQQLGLDVQVDSMDVGTQTQRRANRAAPGKGGWSAFTTTYEGLTMADPATNVGLRGNGEDAWYGWPTCPRLENLREAWFAASQPDEQKRIAADIQQAAFAEVPFIPLGQVFYPTAVRAGIVDILPAAFPIFWNVRKA